MKIMRIFLWGAVSAALLASHSLTAQNFSEVKPAPQQLAWQDLEFGVIIHFSTNTFLNQEWGDGTASPSDFNPTQFNPEQWMRAIRDSGAKYVVFVAKHHDGFCLWPTEQTTYSIKSSPWKNGQGWDRHEPKYKEQDSSLYDNYYLAELTELALNYGDLVEFWLDGAGSQGHVYDFKKIVETLRTYQPNTVVFADTGLFEYGDARWVGTENGRIPYENWNVIDRHGLLRWRPVEADTPLRNAHWFWHPNDEASLKSLDELLTTYEETVGHGGQLMLGLAPDNRGLLPESDVARLKEFGEAIRARSADNLVRQHTPIDGDTEAALDGDPGTFWMAPADSHHAALEVNFVTPITFNRARTMEWLNEGQKIQSYAIEVWDGKAWKTLARAQAIGHEKVDLFAPVTASRVRLRILSSTGPAAIREFQLYNLTSTKEEAKNLAAAGALQ
jgi:alpha-L-fucosidase